MPYKDNERRRANRKKNRDRENEKQRARRKANPEKYREYNRKKYYKYSPERRKELIEGSRQYHINHPKKAMIQGAKKRAKLANVPFDITESDIEIPTHCPILGIPLFRNTGSSRGNSPSLDKIDPLKGYVKGNIQVISQRANLMKLDASEMELLKFANWILMKFKNLAKYQYAKTY